jgi:RimJ/RimL family protein N-acetyltransferase
MTPVRLETERLVLRDLVEADWLEHRALDTDPEIVRFLTNDITDEAGTRAYIERSITAAQQVPRTLYDLAVTVRPDEARLAGKVGVAIKRPQHREAMLWFMVRRDRWGQGLAREAVDRVLEFAFTELGLHRVRGDCDPRNHASWRLMERLGMRREAHFRENWWLKNEWCDSWIYAVLEQDWRARRGGPGAASSPANDED